MNINPELLKELSTLADRIEDAIRRDERARVREQLLARIAAETDPQRRGNYVGDRGPDRRPFRDGSKMQKLYRALASRSYPVTRNTLLRESGMTPRSLWQAMAQLRAHGYHIQCVRAGYRLPRYLLTQRAA